MYVRLSSLTHVASWDSRVKTPFVIFMLILRFIEKRGTTKYAKNTKKKTRKGHPQISQIYTD
jgi:hypothetical protein